MRVRAALLAGLAAALAPAATASAQTVHVVDDNHTDYGWNDTPQAYDAAMLADLDYQLDQIAATGGNLPEEQARYEADCWYYLWNYQRNRPPQQFRRAIDAMASGHLAVPLNPFVLLYGAMSTEAAIRAGYYPGRVERRYGVRFPLAQYIENATSPWGLTAIWAGSGARYTWKGICGCATQAPFRDRAEELFRWRGPAGEELLMKWYQLAPGSPPQNQSYGGYAEARSAVDLADPAFAKMRAVVDRFRARPPALGHVALVGGGWDDVAWRTDVFWRFAQAWNRANPGGARVVTSNAVDFFEAIEPGRAQLPVVEGGWGNDWDVWPAALAEQTARVKRALEALRGAEALAALVHPVDPTAWARNQPRVEAALVEAWKYYNHSFGDAVGAMTIERLAADKRSFADAVETGIAAFHRDAAAALARSFRTPAEDWVAVVNPLGFERTDVVDVMVPGGPLVVTDVATGGEVPSQQLEDGTLRFVASSVPAVGYRLFRIAAGTPSARPDAARVSGATIASARWEVTAGARGELTSWKDVAAGRELAGGALNDFGAGGGGAFSARDVGPVSATLQVDVPAGAGSPPRRVRVTLFAAVERIEITDEILGGDGGTRTYRFGFGLPSPAIHFEEVGAVARPGSRAQGGDFLPGTRADWMTANHFVDLEAGGYSVTLSNWDAIAMQLGDSTPTAFDLPTSTIKVLALGQLAGSTLRGQGGDVRFLHRFALRGSAAAFSGAEAMRFALAHQNPLIAVPLARRQAGPFEAPVHGALSLDLGGAVLMAFKPAEEGERGLVARLWELDGRAAAAAIDASPLDACEAHETSLVETDLGAVAVTGGRVSLALQPHELKAIRVVPGTCSPRSAGSAASGGGASRCAGSSGGGAAAALAALWIVARARRRPEAGRPGAGRRAEP